MRQREWQVEFCRDGEFVSCFHVCGDDADGTAATRLAVRYLKANDRRHTATVYCVPCGDEQERIKMASYHKTWYGVVVPTVDERGYTL